MLKLFLLSAAVFSLSFGPSVSIAAEEDSTTPAGTTAVVSQQNIKQNIKQHVKDDLFVYIHAGGGKHFRILGSIIAGTPVEILDTDIETGFVKIKDNKDRTGWIEKDNLSAQSSIREQLQNLQRQRDESTSLSQDKQHDMDRLSRQLEASGKQNQQLNQRISALEQEKKSLQQELLKSTDKQQQKTLLHGAAIIFGGIMFGLLLPHLVRRRRRNDAWA